MSEKTDLIKENIKKIYLSYEESFVVGFSGGKDSTVLLDLILESLNELYIESLSNISKYTYIISSNTLIENPYVTTSINNSLNSIKDKFAYLKIIIVEVIPKINETFWTSIIGKGYPLPLNRFRWCTRQLKIEPMNNAMRKITNDEFETITVLGIRKDESSARHEKMNKHKVSTSFYRNLDNEKGFIFAPLSNLTTEELWKFSLSKRNTIWGLDYGILYEMYWETSKECPMNLESSYLDNEYTHCGNSRWGCWMCSLSEKIWLDNIVENGIEELKPLVSFRKWMLMTRDERKYRYMGSHVISKNKDSIFITIKRKGYTKMNVESNDAITIYTRPKKGKRQKLEIYRLNDKFYEKNGEEVLVVEFSEFEKQTKGIDKLFNEEGSTNNIFVLNNNELFLPAIGPYTLSYRVEILKRLLGIYNELNWDALKLINIDYIDIISDEELNQIFYYWRLIASKIDKSSYIEEEIKKIKLIINQMEGKHGKKKN